MTTDDFSDDLAFLGPCVDDLCGLKKAAEFALDRDAPEAVFLAIRTAIRDKAKTIADGLS